MGVRVRLDADDAIAAARISMGPVGPVPYLAEPAMETLIGKPAGEEAYVEAVAAALDCVSLRASKYRASHEYREQMLRTFLPAILARAVDRAREAGA